MKKLLLICTLLTGCSSAPRLEQKGAEYTCTAYNLHGTYAKYKIIATSEGSALKIAQQANDNLVAKGILPETAVDCRLSE